MPRSEVKEQGAVRAFSRFTSPLAGQGEDLRSTRRGPGPARLRALPRASLERGRKAIRPRGPRICPQAAAGGGRAALRACGVHNVCRLLSRRAHGFYARDAGIAHRKNLGLLRRIMCQVIGCVPALAAALRLRPFSRGAAVSVLSPGFQEVPGHAGEQGWEEKKCSFDKES